MTSFAADHDMRAPLAGRARQRIVWGGVDPGSARIGIAAAEEIDGKLVAAMTPVVVEVGIEIELPVPLVKTNRRGEEYTIRKQRIVKPEDVKLAVTLTVAHLLQAKVTRVAVERVENPYPGEDEAATMAMMKSAMRTDRIANRIGDALERAGIVVVYVTRQAWTARLRKLVQAVTPDDLPGKGDAVRGRGVALGHVLREQIVGWPTGSGDTEDTRDAGGIVLWQALPAATAWKRPPSAPRTKRVRREGDGGSRQARRDKAQRAAARVDSGCTCGHRGGRHSAGCPMHVAKPNVTKVARWATERAAAGCVCRTGQHGRGCPLSPLYGRECTCGRSINHPETCPLSSRYGRPPMTRNAAVRRGDRK